MNSFFPFVFFLQVHQFVIHCAFPSVLYPFVIILIETCQKGQDLKNFKNIALWKNLLSGSYITDKMSASFKQKTAEFTKNINNSKLAHASLKDWHPTNFCHYYFCYYYYQN